LRLLVSTDTTHKQQKPQSLPSSVQVSQLSQEELLWLLANTDSTAQAHKQRKPPSQDVAHVTPAPAQETRKFIGEAPSARTLQHKGDGFEIVDVDSARKDLGRQKTQRSKRLPDEAQLSNLQDLSDVKEEDLLRLLASTEAAVQDPKNQEPPSLEPDSSRLLASRDPAVQVHRNRKPPSHDVGQVTPTPAQETRKSTVEVPIAQSLQRNGGSSEMVDAGRKHRRRKTTGLPEKWRSGAKRARVGEVSGVQIKGEGPNSKADMEGLQSSLYNNIDRKYSKNNAMPVRERNAIESDPIMRIMQDEQGKVQRPGVFGQKTPVRAPTFPSGFMEELEDKMRTVPAISKKDRDNWIFKSLEPKNM